MEPGHPFLVHLKTWLTYETWSVEKAFFLFAEILPNSQFDIEWFPYFLSENVVKNVVNCVLRGA